MDVKKINLDPESFVMSTENHEGSAFQNFRNYRNSAVSCALDNSIIRACKTQ